MKPRPESLALIASYAMNRGLGEELKQGLRKNGLKQWPLPLTSDKKDRGQAALAAGLNKISNRGRLLRTNPKTKTSSNPRDCGHGGASPVWTVAQAVAAPIPGDCTPRVATHAVNTSGNRDS